jgi:hypothetical protein
MYSFTSRSRISNLHGDLLLFIVLRPTQEFFTFYMETSQLPAKGQIQAYARCSGPLRREGSLSCHTCCDTGVGFSGLIRRTVPFSRLLRHTRGCGGPILTRILMSYLHEEVTISCEGLQHLDLFSVLLWHGTSVFPVSSEGPPHLIRHTRGYGGSILTRILTGYHHKIGQPIMNTFKSLVQYCGI